jgi:hypothetical protein
MFAWIMIRQEGVFALFFGRSLDGLGSLAVQTSIRTTRNQAWHAFALMVCCGMMGIMKIE